MGMKKILIPYTLFNAAVMTGTTTLTSPSTDVRNLDNIGLDIAWIGTAVGTLSIQGSNDNITFRDLTFNPAITQPNNNAGGYLVSLNQFPWFFIRVKYVNASSTGTLTVNLVGKDLN